MSYQPPAAKGNIGNSVFKPTTVTISRGIRFYGEGAAGTLWVMTNWRTFQPTNVANLTMTIYSPVDGNQWRRIGSWVTVFFAMTVQTTAAQPTFTLGELPLVAIEPDVSGTLFTGTGTVTSGGTIQPVILTITPGTSTTNVVVSRLSGNFTAGGSYVFRGEINYLTN